MTSLLWIIPALPFAGFLVLATLGRSLSRRATSIVGVGSVGFSAASTIALAISFVADPPAGDRLVLPLWSWISIGAFRPGITLYLDSLSLLMALVITGVGFLIHLYSTEFMEDDEGYSRFFAYMNLFVGSMLMLVLADNFLLMYLGWEGVGLCSYLLIGFWYRDPANGAAAQKAFIVTRIGDTAMAVGLFLLFQDLGTLGIQDAMHRAAATWPLGSPRATLAALLLLGGAVGKSAQLPLQTWLPDAMAGPSPVSALIHAATMVTAGVYLIARTHVLFQLSPVAMRTVAVIGAATLLIAGFSALAQRDIKRVLAYSTISQIGYMFLALGVGAWGAAMFHFMTHAFFKALLFLAAGVVIEAMHHEHDMFRMGGLRRQLPLTFWTFLAGACSLTALPFVTAGFYSKDLILSEVWGSPQGGAVLWIAGLAGAFLTSLYTFRMVFVTFFGDGAHELSRRPRLRMLLPLAILAVLSIVGGFIPVPSLLDAVLPRFALEIPSESIVAIVTAVVSLLGIALAWWMYLRRPELSARAAATPAVATLRRYWYSGWGFDWLYDHLLVRPYRFIAHADRDDVLDLPCRAIAWVMAGGYRVLSATQSGRVRWYLAGLTGGALIVIAILELS